MGPVGRRCILVVGLVVLAAAGVAGAQRVVQIDAPAILDEPGTTYLLTRDVTAPHTAFIIKGEDITLDLGGHTVTYGTADGDRVSGVFARPPGRDEEFALIPREGFGGASRVTIRNGRIVEGPGTGRYRHGVYMRGGDGLEVSNLRVEVHSPDSNNINILYWGSAHIHHNHFLSRVRVVSNRHYPGQDVIVIWGVGGPIEIDHNTIDGGAQWGIRVSGGDGPPHLVNIHHNLIRHRTYATNGYGLGLHARNMYVYANVVRPVAGRGVHLTGRDIEFFNNIVDVREQPNPEYPRTRAHGVKLEGARSSRVHHNFIRSTAEEGFGDADPLDFDVPPGACNEVFKNTVVALRKTPRFWATTVNLIAQADGNGTVVHDNTFITQQYHIRVDWDGGSGVLFRNNRFEVLGNPADYVFFRCQPSRALDVKNNVFRDNLFVPPASPTVQYMYRDYRPSRIDNRVENTLTVLVTDPAGKEVPDADVVVRLDGRVVARTAADRRGRAAVVLPWLRFVPPKTVELGPYELTVCKPGWEPAEFLTFDLTGASEASEQASRTPEPSPGSGQALLVKPDRPRKVVVRLRRKGALLYVWAGPDQRRLIGDEVTIPTKLVLAEGVTGEPEITWYRVKGRKRTRAEDLVGLQPTVRLDRWGGYTFEVEARLGEAVARDQVYLRANRTLTPTARASAPATARVETIVQLDGSRSTDPVGFPLSYHWKQVSGPEALISSLEWPDPIFYPLQPGRYTFQLTVSNPLGKVSEPVRVTVQVTE